MTEDEELVAERELSESEDGEDGEDGVGVRSPSFSSCKDSVTGSIIEEDSKGLAMLSRSSNSE